MKKSSKMKMLLTISACLLLTQSAIPLLAGAEGKSIANRPLSSERQTAGVATAAKSTALTTKSVESFTDAFFARKDIKQEAPGAVVVVVQDGKVIFQKGYGYADVSTKTPVDPKQTVFRIASISKVFAASAVLQLVEQGKIDLDADVQQYMGDLKLKNKTGHPVTMRHLLTHTSGVEFADADQISWQTAEPNTFYPIKDILRSSSFEIVNKPGEVYSYDNFASMLQGYIVEQVSGMSFQEYVNKHIYKPLQMNNSSFRMTPEFKKKMATGYAPGNVPVPELITMPTDLPQGGMVATGEDMAKYMIAQLNGGEANGARILSAESVDKMLTPQHSIHSRLPNMTFGYEYFNHHVYNGHKFVMKGGDVAGFSSMLWLLPEEKTGVFIVHNQLGQLHGLYTSAFMDQFFPDKRPQPTFLKPKQAELVRFEGVYQDLRNGSVLSKIKANADGTLTYINNLGSQTYRQVEPLYFLNEEGLELAFKEKDGEIRYMYSPNSPVSYVEKLAEPIRYQDVSQRHPYRSYIDGVSPFLDLGGEAGGKLHPTKPLTRAEFIGQAVEFLGLGYNSNKPAFKDIQGHEHDSAIQTAVQLGVIDPNDYKDGKFYPDRVIQRQEAAYIIWSMIGRVKQEASLDGKTEPWAVDAVKFMVANGIYGPEVKKGKNGSLNYQSMNPLLRQEAAALWYHFAIPRDAVSK